MALDFPDRIFDITDDVVEKKCLLQNSVIDTGFEVELEVYTKIIPILRKHTPNLLESSVTEHSIFTRNMSKFHTLYTFLKDDTIPDNEIVNVFFQLVYTLICFSRVNLKHNDLHGNNIFIEKVEPTVLTFGVANRRYQILTEYIPKIYDFDFASCDFTKCNISLDFMYEVSFSYSNDLWSLCYLFCNIKFLHYYIKKILISKNLKFNLQKNYNVMSPEEFIIMLPIYYDTVKENIRYTPPEKKYGPSYFSRPFTFTKCEWKGNIVLKNFNDFVEQEFNYCFYEKLFNKCNLAVEYMVANGIDRVFAYKIASCEKLYRLTPKQRYYLIFAKKLLQ